MSNLGDSNTPIEGASFGLPAGAELGEDNGDLVIQDSSGSIILRRDETNAEWQFENTDLTGINAIDASSANFGSGTIDTESSAPDSIARVSQVQSAASEAIYTDETEPPVPESEAVWFDTSGQTEATAAFTFDTGEDETIPFAPDAAYAPTERVSAHPTSSGNVYAIDANGTNVWTFSVGNSAANVRYAASENIFICASNNSGLFAVNASDGSQAWSNSSAGSGDGLLLAEDQGLAVCAADFDVYAVNLSNGSLEWTYTSDYRIDLGVGYSSSEEVIAFAGGDSSIPEYYIVGLGITDGTEVWESQVSDPVDTGVVSPDGSSFAAGYGSTVEGFDAANGASLWTYTTSGGLTNVRMRHLSSISSYVFGDQDGNVYAVADSDGTETWMNNLDTSSLKSQIAYSSATGSFFIGGDASDLYRVDETDGSEIWAYSVIDEGDAGGGGIYNPDDEIAVYGTGENLILGVNLEDVYTISSLDAVNVTDANTDSWVGKTL